MFFKKREKTYILDGPILADGRVIPLIEKELIYGRFICIPQPAYQAIPSRTNNEETYSARIRENIEHLKKLAQGKVTIFKKQIPKEELLRLAKKNNALIVVADNDAKALLLREAPQTTVKGLKTLNLAELYEILKPDYLPGTAFKVVVTKKGKEVDEGIGYLDGGIKVVVTGGAKAMGKELEVVVQGSIETNVGKLIFAKPKYIEVR